MTTALLDLSKHAPDPIPPAPSNGVATAPVLAQPIANPLVVAPPTLAAPIPAQQIFVRDQPAIDAAVATARKEEKDKLYSEQEKLKKKVKDLEAAQKDGLSPDEKLQAQLAQMQSDNKAAEERMIAAQEATSAELKAEQASRRLADLQAHMNLRLRQYAEANIPLEIGLVGGSTEAAIDASCQLAQQEYARQEAHFFAQFQAQQPQLPTAVSVHAAPGPSQFPTAPNAAPVTVASPGVSGFAENVSELTSPEAVRSGAYAQHRERLLAMTQQGGGPGPGGQFSNQPRYTAHTVQVHGAVQQPQGLPTPPVQNPNVRMPGVPQTPPNVLYQPSHMMPPSAPQYAPQMQHQVAPQAPPAGLPSQGFDPAAARAHAVAAATSHLANPGGAPAPGVTSGMPGGLPAAAPNTNANFQGVNAGMGHPMSRNAAG